MVGYLVHGYLEIMKEPMKISGRLKQEAAPLEHDDVRFFFFFGVVK